jgi:hypothetical protein
MRQYAGANIPTMSDHFGKSTYCFGAVASFAAAAT